MSSRGGRSFRGARAPRPSGHSRTERKPRQEKMAAVPFIPDNSSDGGNARKNKTYTRTQLKAIKRLLKDVAELQNTPIPTVNAAPLDDDLFVWHGNLRGPAQSPFEGGIFHIALTFPDDYPDSPPHIKIFNDIPHPFVEGDSLCLNMLNKHEKDGWTPAYSVQSVLLQLQSFLLDGLESFQVRPGYAVKEISQKQTSQWKEVFENKDHEGDGTLKPTDIRDLMLEVGERKPSVAELALYYRMLDIPEDQPIEFSTFLRIMQRKREYRRVVEEANRYSCNHPKCKHCPQKVSPPFLSPQDSDFLMKVPEQERLRQETICFYSRRSYLPPENATLGVGIAYMSHFRTGKLYSITSPLDVISLNSFRKCKGKHMSADGKTEYTHWMPLFIDDQHGPRAMKLAERALGIICGQSHRSFKPEMALEVFPKLLSGLVLELTKGELFKTVRVLRGYCAFHRLFIAFAQKYPEIKKMAEEQLTKFIQDPLASRKNNLNVLADILPLLSIAEGIDFKKVAEVYLAEIDARNVVWITKKKPAFVKTEPDAKIDRERPAATFEICKASYHLLMLHHAITEMVVRKPKASLADIAKIYDERCGQPTIQMLETLQKAYAEVKQIATYQDLYARLGLKVPTDEEVNTFLRKAVENSAARHYHGERVLNVVNPDDYHKELLKEFPSLSQLISKDKVAAGMCTLVKNEDMWKDMCAKRFGISELKDEIEGITEPWKHRYLKENLQDVLSKLNENPDFKALYEILDLSAPTLRSVEHTVIPTLSLKSDYHFLTAVLSRLPQLQKFVLRKGEALLGIKGCKSLCKGLMHNTALRSLDLAYSRLPPDCLKMLESGLMAATGLVHLNVEGNPLGSEGAKSIAKVLMHHRGLVTLNVANCQINRTGAQELARSMYHNQSIKTLIANKNPVEAAGLAMILKNLSYSPNIQHIGASKIDLSGDSRDQLSGALVKLFEVSTSLKTINFFQTSVDSYLTDDVLHALSRNRSMEFIDLGTSGISDRVLGPLGWAVARNKLIKRLSAERNHLSATGITELSNAIYDNEDAIKRRKDRAALGASTVADEEEMLRPRGCKIEELNFSGNSLSFSDNSTGQLAFERLVQLSTSLVTLDLESCSLGVASGKALGAALASHPTLITLKLSNNQLGEHGIRRLTAGLATNKVLENIDLSYNDIGGRGAKYIGQLLVAPGIAIKSMNLYANFIGIEGARYISEAVGKNDSLTYLDLGLNRIRPKGASALAASIALNGRLRVLKLKLNFINDRTAIEIGEAIKKMPLQPGATQRSLEKLSLAGNKIKDSTLQAVIDSVAPHTKLDVAEHLKVTAPEHIVKTVLCAPLPLDISEEKLKKIFYDNKCGVIVSVKIHERKQAGGKSAPRKRDKKAFQNAKFAFVEFKDDDSVDAALDLGEQKKAKIGKNPFRVIQCRRKTAFH